MIAWWMAIGLAGAGESPSAAWLESVLERPWEGMGTQVTEVVKGGRLVTSHTLTWTANETMQLSGTFTTKLILDDVSYLATYAIRGEYLSSQEALVVRAQLTRADTLPRGMSFCAFTGKLQIGNDTSRPGHFAIWGPLDEDCGDSIVNVELRDRGPDPTPTATPSPATP